MCVSSQHLGALMTFAHFARLVMHCTLLRIVVVLCRRSTRVGSSSCCTCRAAIASECVPDTLCERCVVVVVVFVCLCKPCTNTPNDRVRFNIRPCLCTRNGMRSHTINLVAPVATQRSARCRCQCRCRCRCRRCDSINEFRTGSISFGVHTHFHGMRHPIEFS